MPSSKEYAEYIFEQLSEAGEITKRAMMGEYIIYCRGVVVGGVYDNRLLIKPTKSAVAYLTEHGKASVFQLPYEGAKEMLFTDEIDDRHFLAGLVEAAYADLSAKRK